MPDTFDPYLKWLGIPADRRPPDHYRLLGLDSFTENPDVIENAANRQLRYVQSLQSGERAALAEQLIKQIISARDCLLDAPRKTAYDAALRTRGAARQRAAKAPATAKGAPRRVVAQTVATAVRPEANDGNAPPAVPDARRRTRRSILFPVLSGGLLIVVAGTAVLVYLVFRSTNDQLPGDAASLPPSQDLPQGKDGTTTPDRSIHQRPNSSDGVATKKSSAPPPPTPPDPPEILPDSPDDPPDDGQVSPAARPDDPHPAPNPQRGRLPIPDDAQVQQALVTVRELFEQDRENAKTEDEKRELIQRILRLGLESEKQAAMQFVLFRVARDLAADWCDAGLAVEAARLMAAAFQIDDAETRCTALRRAAKHVNSVRQYEGLAGVAALTIRQQLIPQDRHDIALQLTQEIESAAQRTGDADTIRAAADVKTSVNSQIERFLKYQQALATLDTEPDASEANLIAGKYRCFVKGDWPAGLLMLAKGSDATLKDIALRELAAIEASDVAQEVALGDAWYGLAEASDDKFSKLVIFGRAQFWLKLAIATMPNNLLRIRTERRLATIDALQEQHADDRQLNLPAVDKVSIVVFNAHNGIIADRGSEEFSLVLLAGDAVVWRKDKVPLPWSPYDDAGVELEPPPGTQFDRVRVEVTRLHGRGAGLSEVQVIRSGRNIARYARVMSSPCFDNRFDPVRIRDGIANSNDFMNGYWLLKDDVNGWVELDLTEANRLPPRRLMQTPTPTELVIWNAHNAQHGDRGTDEIDIHMLQQDRIVWSKENVKLPASPFEDKPLRLEVPSRQFDKVRVEIHKYHRRGAGLSEIEVIRDGVNIARGGTVTASARWNGSFAPNKVNDGIQTSDLDRGGYWLLPNHRTGWIEIDLNEIDHRSDRRVTPPPVPKGQWIELLPLVDLRKHVVNGTWHRQKDGIHSAHEATTCRVIVPVVPHGEYDLELDFTRATGNAHTTLFIPVFGRRTMLVLSGECGLELINGKRWRENETSRSFTFEEGARYRYRIQVRGTAAKASVAITLDGEPFLSWRGAASAFTITDGWRMPPPPTFGFGSDNVYDVFHALRFKLISGEAKILE